MYKKQKQKICNVKTKTFVQKKPQKTKRMSSKKKNKLIKGYIRQHLKKNIKLFPFVIEVLIIEFSKKIIESNLLTFKDDLCLLKIMNEKLLFIYKNKRIKIIYDFKINGKKIYDNALNYEETLTLFKTKSGETFGIYLSRSWRVILRLGLDCRCVAFYMDKNLNFIRYCSLGNLNRPLKVSVPYSLKDIPIHKNKMIEFQIFRLRKYSSKIRPKTPESIWHSSDSDNYDMCSDCGFVF